MTIPLPLSGISIIDLTTQIPGPFCTMHLADLGAHVIKVESLSGDPLRAFPSMFASVNRGKRSITLNLKNDRGKEILQRLLKTADVLMEGFRPGVVQRLGADYDMAKGIKPDIVYCSISGFGQTGPYRGRAGHDVNYISIGGLMGQAEIANDRPSTPPVLISDMASGMYAAMAVLAALRHRDSSGLGQYIDLSMTDAVVSWMAPEIARAHDMEEAPDRPLLSGLPHYDVFKTSDDLYLSIGIVYESHFWGNMCDALDIQEWQDLTTHERSIRSAEIKEKLTSIFKTETRSYWDKLLQSHDVPCGPVYDVKEIQNDPQFKHRGTFSDLDATDGSSSRQVAPPFRFENLATGSDVPPPSLGGDTDDLLFKAGYSR
ncbi:MAG: CoA transferase, partial [Candidatus Latescibacteria bacterium]|nr:CoA transferase [Candidatus Latescibacterota bacterium]